MPVILLNDQMRAPVIGDGSMAVDEGSVGDPRVKLLPNRAADPADAVAAANMSDLVKRDFTPDRPGRKFVGDITYIHTWQGFVY